MGYFFPSVLRHCWLGDEKGIWPGKMFGRWCVHGDDLTGALVCVGGDTLTGTFHNLIAPAVTTTSIILGSNKILNGDALALACQGCPGKRPLNEHHLRPHDNYIKCFDNGAMKLLFGWQERHLPV